MFGLLKTFDGVYHNFTDLISKMEQEKDNEIQKLEFEIRREEERQRNLKSQNMSMQSELQKMKDELARPKVVEKKKTGFFA